MVSVVVGEEFQPDVTQYERLLKVMLGLLAAGDKKFVEDPAAQQVQTLSRRR